MSTSPKPPELRLEPIGYLRSPDSSKSLLSPQPGCHGQGGYLELLPRYAPALADLEGFSRIWVLWWFHRNSGWRPKVLPPHGRSGRKGLFATRSPYRPNPLGLSCVPLLGVEGTIVRIGPHDLLDGTPVLDLKPYLPRFDSFPEERSGWFDEVQMGGYQVEWSPRAAGQLAWLEREVHPEFARRLGSLLENDPLPHRTRRIMAWGDGYRLKFGSWRVFYAVADGLVRVDRIESRFTEDDGTPEGALHARYRLESNRD